MIGIRLAHYDITAHLGSGGMGDVYQATDSKLARCVALKLLPEAFASSTERVARFEREARVLASLNHPHIAAIYGLEESADRKFLVMELVGGETLAARISRSPIPVNETLHMAVQIAEALEAAHEKGVVHRDLKPANIKITPDGSVKVLDFGLAKALDTSPADASGTSTGTEGAALSNSPTLSMAATQAGMILGTAAYMSPEQAKGRPIDRKTDIFAFGCVLYEMLTGRAAFEGDSVPQILARVLEREPDWSLLPAAVPGRIRELLRLCLAKNPKDRRCDAGDVRIDILQALKEPDAIALPPLNAPAKTRWMLRAAIVVLALAAIAATVFALRPPPRDQEMRLDITTPPTTLPLHFVLAPDGQSIVFVASGDGAQRLWVRRLDKATAQVLPGTDGAIFPFWSPDSRSVGFFAGAKVKRVDVAGGLPQTVADAGLPRGGTWNNDGNILYTPNNAAPLFVVAASGGKATAVTQLQADQISHRFPQFLPDGKRFLFFGQGGPENHGIYLGTLDGTTPVRLTAADTAGVWLPPDHIVFVRQGTLVAQRVDLSAQKIVGEAEIVADQVGYDPGAFLGAFSASAQGRIAYRAGGAEQRQLAWFDRSGKPLGLLGQPDASSLVYPEFSPNGQRLAIDRTVENNRDLWIMDLAQGNLTRLTFDGGLDGIPVWSPDGNQIAFASSRKGSFDLYVKPSNGAGPEQVLLEEPGIQVPQDWSRDGRFLLYFDARNGGDLWALPMTGTDRKPIPVATSPLSDRVGSFSPDGRWVAYDSNESGRFEVLVQPFPNPTGKWQVSTAGGSFPRWSKDGKELYFIAPDGNLMATAIRTSGSSVELQTPVPLFPARVVGVGSGTAKPQYDVTDDGRFLLNQPVENSVATPITLILNWRPATDK